LSLYLYPVGKAANGQEPVAVNSFEHIDKSGAEAYSWLNVANHPVADGSVEAVKAFKPHINEFMKILKRNFPV
jgi:hypothetical protein